MKNFFITLLQYTLSFAAIILGVFFLLSFANNIDAQNLVPNMDKTFDTFGDLVGPGLIGAAALGLGLTTYVKGKDVVMSGIGYFQKKMNSKEQKGNGKSLNLSQGQAPNITEKSALSEKENSDLLNSSTKGLKEDLKSKDDNKMEEKDEKNEDQSNDLLKNLGKNFLPQNEKEEPISKQPNPDLQGKKIPNPTDKVNSPVNIKPNVKNNLSSLLGQSSEQMQSS